MTLLDVLMAIPDMHSANKQQATSQLRTICISVPEQPMHNTVYMKVTFIDVNVNARKRAWSMELS